MYLRVRIDEVAGIEEALTYMGLPMITDGMERDIGEFTSEGLPERLIEAGDDHGKFMRQIQVWMRVRAPRFWWQEMDTYQVGVSKISESTMHTLRESVQSYTYAYDFFKDNFYTSTMASTVTKFFFLVKHNPELDISEIKANLPEGWMQTRGLNVNYQTLRRIFHQRKNHRLTAWKDFLKQVLQQIPHPEWITIPDDVSKWT